MAAIKDTRKSKASLRFTTSLWRALRSHRPFLNPFPFHVNLCIRYHELAYSYPVRNLNAANSFPRIETSYNTFLPPFVTFFSLISGENSLVQIFYYTPRVPKRIQEIARRIEFDDISKRHGSSTRKQKSFEDGGEKFRRGVKLPLWEHGGKGQATSTGDDPGNNVPPTFTHPHAHPCCVCIFAKNARTEWQGRAVNSRWEFEEPCSTPPLLECVSSPIFVLQAWESMRALSRCTKFVLMKNIIEFCTFVSIKSINVLRLNFIIDIHESEIFSRKIFKYNLYTYTYIYIENSENDITYRGNKTW